MPIDDLTALGQKMREARKNKELTQQELSDLSHVSVVSVLYSFGLPAFFALKQLNHQSA